AINHGMTSEFLDKVREVSKKFFALPMEEKLRYSREMNDWDGYGNDTIVSEQQTLDWTDRLYLTVYPEDQRKLKYWPENPLVFRETIHEYTLKLKEMFAVLLKAMARSTNLEEDCFLKEHGDLVIMAARFNFYPPCPTPENVLGVKPHADGTTITMLLQDKEIEGLQVLKDDQWFRVPIVPDAVFVNVGDLLEIMSNGILKSPMHRVVINSESDRISVAMFSFLDPDREVGPITELITDDKPQMYKRVKHYENIFFENYQLGKRPLHAVRM
ncbi:Codeine O-demethylase, partial [Bienertia sinuspersici]